MSVQRKSIWSDFPTRGLAEKYRIDGTSKRWKVIQIAMIILFSLGSYLVASQFVWKSVRIVGRSMEPTFHEGQLMILNRWVYLFRDPRPGDVVVFSDPDDRRLSIKRIVGRPGDLVEVLDGEVRVNSSPLSEDYLADGTRTFASSHNGQQRLVVDRHSFYVLGDNRGDSADSRLYGPVPEDNIMGKIW